MESEISPQVLRRYVEIRHIIQQDIKTLHALSSVMAMFKEMHDDKVVIDPQAIGRVYELMNHAVSNIWEKLDDFIPLTSAELALEKLKKTEGGDVG